MVRVYCRTAGFDWFHAIGACEVRRSGARVEHFLKVALCDRLFLGQTCFCKIFYAWNLYVSAKIMVLFSLVSNALIPLLFVMVMTRINGRSKLEC